MDSIFYNSGLSYSILRFTNSLLVVESILSHFIRFSSKFPQFNAINIFFIKIINTFLIKILFTLNF